MSEVKTVKIYGTVVHPEYVKVEVLEGADQNVINMALLAEAQKQFEERGSKIGWIIHEQNEDGFQNCSECGQAIPDTVPRECSIHQKWCSLHSYSDI